MEIFETAVSAVTVFSFGAACVAGTCLLICEIVNNITHTRYTSERTAFIRAKRLEIERQRKDGQA